MRTLFLLLLSASAAFAQLNISNPFYVAGVLKPSSGVGNITATLWQTFESTLDASGLGSTDNATGGTWSVSGAGSSVGSAAQQAPWFTVNTTTDTGAQGLIRDNNTGSGSIQFEPPSYPTSTNIFLMFRVTAMTDGVTDVIAGWGESSTTDNICRFRATRSGSTYAVSLQQAQGATVSSDVTISVNTWYGASIYVVSGGTCTLRVYTTSGSAVGSEVSVAGQTRNFWYHIFPAPAGSSTGQREVDNYCLGTTYPLIP